MGLTGFEPVTKQFEDIFKVHPNEVARLLPGQCFVVYNRYVAKIHSQMVGTVPNLMEAIRVYKKPATTVTYEQETDKRESSKKKAQRPTKKTEVVVYDKQTQERTPDTPRVKDEI